MKLPLARQTELRFKSDFFSMKAVASASRVEGTTASTQLQREGNGPHSIQLCGRFVYVPPESWMVAMEAPNSARDAGGISSLATSKRHQGNSSELT